MMIAPATQTTPAGHAPHPLRWTAGGYDRAVAAGAFDGMRVELIDGELYQMSPQSLRHSQSVWLVRRALEQLFGQTHVVLCQAPLNAGTLARPEPDVAVVPGDFQQRQTHPDTALLVVEVADSSLAYDRAIKAPVYAAMGVADYWVVNLLDHRVEVCREPVAGDEQAPNRYTRFSTHGPEQTITPLAAPDARLAVGDLLP